MISETLKEVVKSALSELGVSKGDFAVEHPDELSHGDYSTNAALVFSKDLKMNPHELAEKLVIELEKMKQNKTEETGLGQVLHAPPRD